MQHLISRHDPQNNPTPHFRDMLPHVQLEITCGRTRNTLRSVERSTYFIGSGRDCDLVLGDPKFAEIHAYLLVAPYGVAIRHLGHLPQLLVDGCPVRRAMLEDGARVQTGPFELTVHISPPRACPVRILAETDDEMPSIESQWCDADPGLTDQIVHVLETSPPGTDGLGQCLRLQIDAHRPDPAVEPVSVATRRHRVSIGVVPMSVTPPRWLHLCCPGRPQSLHSLHHHHHHHKERVCQSRNPRSLD